MNNTTNKKHRIVAAGCVLCMAIAGSALAHGDKNRDWDRDHDRNPEKGIVDLTTSYGASGAIASVAGVSGVSGATDSIQVTFAKPMHPGNFGMGVNFAKGWTKSWNADNTVLTVGGDIDFSDADEPALIVYLMQTEADKKDISEPNIFKFQDIKMKGIKAGNGQVTLDIDSCSADDKGYSVYVAKAKDGRFKRYSQVNFNSKGAQIKGLENGETYLVYVEYKRNGLVATRTAPVTITLPKHPGKDDHWDHDDHRGHDDHRDNDHR